MLKGLGDKMMRKMVKATGLFCPGCGGVVELPEDTGDDGLRQVVRCGGCGRLASAGELFHRGGRGDGGVWGVVEKPAGTKIVRRDLAGGAAAWEVPASGKSGGLLVFGVIWLLISLGAGGTMTLGKVQGDGPPWFVFLFISLFIGIGVAVTYFGIRNKYCMNLIVVKPDSVMLVRSLFGRKKTRKVNRSGLKWVKKQVFYEQNYEPVYGVEVKGLDGKLRFGSTLEEDEKDWLVSEIRGAIGEGEEEDVVSKWPRGERFVMELPERKGGAEVVGLGLGLAVSGVFVLIGIFLLGEAGFFQYVWTGFAGIFFLACLAGAFQMARNAGTEIELVVDRDSVVVRRKKNGLTVKEEDLPRKEVEAVRVYDSGSRQNRAGHCMELLTATTTLHVVKWEVREGLPEFGEELAGRLGLDG